MTRTPEASWFRDTNADRLSAPVEMPVEVQDGANTQEDAAMDLLDETDRRILASVILSVDVTEVYSPERVNKLAKKFGLVAGSSMDLTNGYDFTEPEDRRRAWSEIKKTEPFLIIGSPPCTLSVIFRN